MIEKSQSDFEGFTIGIKITELAHIYNCVVNSYFAAGIPLVNGTDWLVLWTGNVRHDIVSNVNKY